jgi:hypothetical protein
LQNRVELRILILPPPRALEATKGLSLASGPSAAG